MSNAFKRLAPLFNRVVVRKFDPVQKSAGGIILQDASSDKGSIAEVVEVGPGAYDTQSKTVVPVSVKKGDTVLLPDYGGSKITLKEGEFYVYRDSDIVGILHKD